MRWLRIGIELKRRQIEAESGDTDRRFADIHAVDLVRRASERMIFPSRQRFVAMPRKCTNRRNASTKKTPEPHFRSSKVSCPNNPCITSTRTSETNDKHV